MRGITIRQMREDDCPQVSRLQCASFEYGALRAGYSAEQIAAYHRDRGSIESIRARLLQSHCHVACRGDQVVGVAGINGNEIATLYVDPECLRQGIGSRLFEVAARAIARAGHREILLGTIFPGAIPFYLAMGMAEAGRKRVAGGPMAGAESTLLKKPASALGSAPGISKRGDNHLRGTSGLDRAGRAG